jgi:hypothetical protein
MSHEGCGFFAGWIGLFENREKLVTSGYDGPSDDGGECRPVLSRPLLAKDARSGAAVIFQHVVPKK